MNLFKQRNPKQYRTAHEYASNRSVQSSMSPQVVAELRLHGVTESTTLKLEVFFYTNAMDKASNLKLELDAMKYEVEVTKTDIRRMPLLVNGWSPRIRMDEVSVVQWTRQMCDLGQKHDCEFDGWGTTPIQED